MSAMREEFTFTVEISQIWIKQNVELFFVAQVAHVCSRVKWATFVYYSPFDFKINIIAF